MPGITWRDQYGISSSEQEINFLRTLEDLLIKNMVYFLTFLNTNGHKENTLDLIFTSKPERLLELKSLPPLGDLCRAHVVLDYRSAKPAYFESISKEISQIDWDEEFQNLNCKECYESFVGIYENVCKKYTRKR